MKLKDKVKGTKKIYVKPIVEIYEIQAEKGFAGSHGHGHGHGGGHAHGKAGKWDEIEDIDEWD